MLKNIRKFMEQRELLNLYTKARQKRPEMLQCISDLHLVFF